MTWRNGQDGPSTPPDSPQGFRKRHESLLPPRNVPSALGAGTFISAAGVASFEIHDPMQRALAMAACGLLAFLVGYFTEPPRRRFRRDDR